MGKSKNRSCFVPGCTSGYKSNKNKISVFATPKDEALFEKWSKVIPRTDKKLDRNSVVCEKHFDQRFIERYYKYVIDKKEVLLPRTTPRLTADAFPSIFPNLPNYLTKLLPPIQSVKISDGAPTTKKQVDSFECSISSPNHFLVKREFFKYFKMGLSASSAKKKFTMHCTQNKTSKKNPTLIPTLRQTEMLYKEWLDMKDEEEWKDVQDNLDSAMKEGIWRKSEEGTITFKEILDAVPKREIMHSVKHLEAKTDTSVVSNKNAQNQDIKFPLVFVAVGSAAGMPDGTAPLLYKLKHDVSGELVSDLVRPRIYSLYIESENSTQPVTNEIIGIPTSAEESCVSFEAFPKYTLDIPIKLEPLNDGYEDVPTQGSNGITEDTSILSSPVQTFSCEGSTTGEVGNKPNICRGNTITEEIDIKPDICKTGSSLFPLMFTLKGSVYETSNSRSLVYDLKQSSTGVQATEAVISQIASVQINSLKEATFYLKDSSMLTAEGPLNITIQTELLEVNSNTVSSNNGVNERVDCEDIPVIIEASSCSDHFPVITDYETLKEQLKISDPEIITKPGAYKRLKTEIKQEASNFNSGFFTLY